MKISKQELIVEASKTGFRPEILEKVWRLMFILDDISKHPILKDNLALKGGTALNLFLFNLPRLSVDIDLNYIGKLDREEMLKERPQIEKALESIFKGLGLSINRIPQKHAGGKWRLRYESALGIGGNLEVDLNFMFRVPLCEIQRSHSHVIGGRRTEEIVLLDIHELGAGKLAALFNRHASRDLFDAFELLTKGSLDFEKLRIMCLLYGAMGTTDWRDLSQTSLHFDEKELQRELIPVLRTKMLGSSEKWEDWANKLLQRCKNALAYLFPLREQEILFLNRLVDEGIIEPQLITEDIALIERIKQHPALIWKSENTKRNKQKKITAKITSMHSWIYPQDETFTVIVLPLENNLSQQKPQRKFITMQGKEINELNATKKVWCQPLNTIDFDRLGEVKYEHDKLYEVVLMYITDGTAKTFVSYDSIKKNSKKTELTNAEPGAIFTVPGYFLNDWNNRLNPVTGHVYYWFQPLKGVPEDIKTKMLTFAKS